MSKHKTWRVVSTDEGLALFDVIEYDGEENWLVAADCTYDNAHLIASAPALLAACEAAEAWSRQWPAQTEIGLVLNAAISAAKGET